MQKRKTFGRFGILLSICFGLLTLLLISVAIGPDRDLHYTREIPSSLSAERLDRSMSSVSRWPQWFYTTSAVQVIQSDSKDSSLIHKGTLLQIQIDPGKGARKRFDLTAKVSEYIPGRQLSLEILKDSTGRLNQLFDQLNWNIELIPNGSGTLIRATVSAHTQNWRARLFGQVAEKILMNQVFYPNVIKLADLKQPFTLEQSSQSAGLFSP